MVVVGSVHKLRCLGVLEEAVGQQGDSVCVCVCLSMCMCVCKHSGGWGWVCCGVVWVSGRLLGIKNSCFVSVSDNSFSLWRTYWHHDTTASAEWRTGELWRLDHTSRVITTLKTKANKRFCPQNCLLKKQTRLIICAVVPTGQTTWSCIWRKPEECEYR